MAATKKRKRREVCVTGATGFVGAHVTRLLVERGDRVRAGYRNPDRLERLAGLDVTPVQGEVLDMDAMRRAIRGTDVVFHVAGYVASRPTRKVWEINARSPLVAVEAAALEGAKRVVLTSTISAVGTANGTPANEENPYPDEGLGLTYADSKRGGEREALAAGERLGVEVVVVNPAYVLGVPVDHSQPGETSTRIVGNYLRGRLPAVLDAPMNFVDVEDVAAGHLLAADRGRPGERYILGGHNRAWAELIDMVADVVDEHRPLLVIPPEIAIVGRLRERLGLPGMIAAEAYALMGQDWRFSSAKAKRELGYRSRPLKETVRATAEWYLDLIAAGVFDDSDRSAMSVATQGLQLAGRFGLLWGLRPAQAIVRRRLVAGR
jgi:dihydroflavonol-4-reductase